MRHPNIVQVYGYFMNDLRMNIVMELSGTDLATFLKSNKNKLTWADKRILAKQAVLAVHYLHSRNVIHRDIKGNNFVVRCVLAKKSDTFDSLK